MPVHIIHIFATAMLGIAVASLSHDVYKNYVLRAKNDETA